jgi:SAM-dependent methyltransferase
MDYRKRQESSIRNFLRHIIYKWIGAPNFIKRIEWARLLEWLDPKEGERVLDVACGRGTLTLKIAEKGCRVCGIDISEDVINSAIQFAKREKIACEFQIGDAECLPYPDDCFDKVISSSSLEHFKDDLSALKEMNRVLRPRGVAVITVDSLTYPIGSKTKERHREISSVVNYYTKETLKKKFEGAGFNLIGSKYLLSSYITNFYCKLRIKFWRSGILWLSLFPVAYICLISDKLFGAEDKGFTLLAAGEKISQV